ncbi:YdeI/OmpD-associated family protein [Xanthomonas campestris pv. raphani]|uniref:YdeI/OmpD-associated family protein n=1 Tax=Xanthomonas campestris TaxID=339 RepID=UPI002367C1AC|nr:YdeI/OmpD-associated family protein [Xanthomonas campestris]MEA9656168.1 YdeI/OmpD-associated family protein [Xanthomonas campestris pv. raphani]MEA9757100.1 YdeI/OmpD-associated family protein [Xanthomonas campestris pv. raphani]MEA9765166.1 YdeI/OmpD-associated family protein [Xanthomonas campestris pv. raphani]MEA9817403.1 YdeI/OmpD-associated family protein [Xanthomonas campestris pv. raphani]MEA9825751.1 YdeI/OmpD-associated family protein [Xanthomonas campestris pv. raphani]
MTEGKAAIRCKVTLLEPATPAGASWVFLLLTSAVSNELHTRSMVSVRGRLAGHPLQATLQPDGQGGHWLKLDAALQRAAGVAAGDTVTLEIAPAEVEPEPVVPDDLHAALAAHPAAQATWNDITAVARRDWIFWVTSGKKAETRSKRIATACDMLGSGKRRACCFDRSGMYSKSLSAPTPKAS